MEIQAPWRQRRRPQALRVEKEKPRVCMFCTHKVINAATSISNISTDSAIQDQRILVHSEDLCPHTIGKNRKKVTGLRFWLEGCGGQWMRKPRTARLRRQMAERSGAQVPARSILLAFRDIRVRILPKQPGKLGSSGK